MALDADLADRVRALLADEHDLIEKRMFGGLAFLVGGNLAVAASDQGVLVRVDPSDTDRLVETTSARPMEMRGREMTGWVRVATADIGTERQLAPWVERGVRRARSLPPKP